MGSGYVTPPYAKLDARVAQFLAGCIAKKCRFSDTQDRFVRGLLTVFSFAQDDHAGGAFIDATQQQIADSAGVNRMVIDRIFQYLDTHGFTTVTESAKRGRAARRVINLDMESSGLANDAAGKTSAIMAHDSAGETSTIKAMAHDSASLAHISADEASTLHVNEESLTGDSSIDSNDAELTKADALAPDGRASAQSDKDGDMFPTVTRDYATRYAQRDSCQPRNY